jgi:dTDP-4-dehydrorhamnose reductase
LRILVTGSAGQVGGELVQALHAISSVEVLATTRDQLDLSDAGAIQRVVREFAPGHIIHTAAFTAVDRCESEEQTAFAINATATAQLVAVAGEVGARLTYLSTDYVFDGEKSTPYLETDRPNPQSIYGRSKFAGEQAVGDQGQIVRISWVCGRLGQNMVKTLIRLAVSTDGPLYFVDDQHGCPTLVADLVPTLIRLVLEAPLGTYHVTNQGATTWYEFARSVIALAGGDPERVQPIATVELDPPRPAPRPKNSVLENAQLRQMGWPLLPDWQSSVAALVHELTQR